LCKGIANAAVVADFRGMNKAGVFDPGESLVRRMRKDRYKPAGAALSTARKCWPASGAVASTAARDSRRAPSPDG
jgi:hypothetical protein